MAITRGKNKLRRCEKKPRRTKPSFRRRAKHADSSDSDDNQWRMDDGASAAYRKLGRSGFENYAKHMARLWWNMPHVVSSGLTMETSKHRIRGGPSHDEDDDFLTQGYPQPHYVLKVLKTAFKIYRIRLKKRHMVNSKNKKEWIWSKKMKSEEPAWASIIDSPLYEQYILMLQYIRTLANRLAREKGHNEIICSATPMRVLEQLHPLLHLDFRGAKHYLPKPFIESSDSETQMRIDDELDKLDKALAKKRVVGTDKAAPYGLIAAEELQSTSSTSSSSSSSAHSDKQHRKRSDKSSTLPLKKNLNAGIKILEREGEVYEAYRDPDSDESIFIDFADLEADTTEKAPEVILSNIDKLLKQYDIRERKSVESRRGTYEFHEHVPIRISRGSRYTGRSSYFGSNDSSRGTLFADVASTSSSNSRPSESRRSLFHRSSRSGPSNADDLEAELENDDVTEDITPPSYSSHIHSNSTISTIIPVTQIQTDDSETCTLTTINCHGDHIPAKLRSTKRISNNMSTIEQEVINQEQIITAAGDACSIIATATRTNEVLNDNLINSVNSINTLISSMTRFSEVSNKNLDKIERCIINIENVMPNVNISRWDQVKRHITLIIKRYPRISA